MKKPILIKSIPALVLCALVLGACSREMDDPAGQNDRFGEATDVEPSPIAFSSQAFDTTKSGEEDAPQVPLCVFQDAVGGEQTKTTLSGSTLYWANGDGIAVYEYLSGTLKQSDRCTTTSTSTTGSFTPVTSAKQQNTSWMTATGAASESYDFYSYYPASGSIASPSAGAVTLTNVAASQAGTLAGIGQYLICYGSDTKSRSQIAAGTYPAFAFEPNVAIIHVTLTNNTGASLSNFRDFTVTADGSTGIVGDASLNLSTGVLTPSASTKAVSSSASASSFANSATKEYYFAVMPSATATKLSFSASATNASSETYSLSMADYSLNGGIFGGYIYNIPVSVSSAALTATNVTITSSAATLWKGKTTTYAANITYSGGSARSATSSDVTWSSSNTSVATVNSSTGVVTAVNYGEATITATSKVTGSVTGTKSVYVNAVNSLTFSPTSTTVQTDGGTANITATVTLNNGSAHYGSPSSVVITTTSSATRYVTVGTSYTVSTFSSGVGTVTVVATGVNAGTASVTGTVNNSNYTTVDGNNKTATCTVGAVGFPEIYYGNANSYFMNSSTSSTTVIDVTPYKVNGTDYAYTGTVAPSPATVNKPSYAHVLWVEGLSITNVDANLSVSGPDASGKYSVSVTASGTGNASIGIFNSSNQLLWSFHLWSPGVDPTNSSYTKTYNSSYVVMNYQLGAVTAPPNTESGTLADGMSGLYYQWGRKDPLGRVSGTSSSTTFVSTTAKTVNGVTYYVNGVTDQGVVAASTAGSSVDEKMKYSILHPNQFIIRAGDSTYDWLTNTSGEQIHTLWNTSANGTKPSLTLAQKDGMFLRHRLYLLLNRLRIKQI